MSAPVIDMFSKGEHDKTVVIDSVVEYTDSPKKVPHKNYYIKTEKKCLPTLKSPHRQLLSPLRVIISDCTDLIEQQKPFTRHITR